jgi:hypothetical protein
LATQSVKIAQIVTNGTKPVEINVGNLAALALQIGRDPVIVQN